MIESLSLLHTVYSTGGPRGEQNIHGCHLRILNVPVDRALDASILFDIVLHTVAYPCSNPFRLG